MIKAVFFDIDDTMYDFTGTHRIAMKALTDYCRREFPEVEADFQKTFTSAQATIERRTGTDCAANHNRLIRFQCILDLWGIQAPSKALEMYHTYWDTLLSVMEPEPGLLKLVAALRNRGILLGIGSDMTAYIQYKKLEKLGVLDDISRIVVSEEAGAEKPAPRFFQLCVEKMGCRPEECVFIGDSLRKDVRGAIDCGLHGVWYRPRSKYGEEETEYPCIRSFEDCVRGGVICLGEGLRIA